MVLLKIDTIISHSVSKGSSSLGKVSTREDKGLP